MKVNDGSIIDEIDVHRDVPESISKPTPLELWCANLEPHETNALGLSEPVDYTAEIESPLAKDSLFAELEGLDSNVVSSSTESEVNNISTSESFFNYPMPLKHSSIKSTSNSSGSKANNTSSFESFFSDPAPYFEDISSLENRLFNLEDSIFKNIRWDDGQCVLPLPAFEFDTTPFDSYQQPPLLSPLMPLTDKEESVRITTEASLKTLSAIRGGIKLLHDEGFCSHQGYNIIVVDPGRPSVLNVRPISVPRLTMLNELLREGASNPLQWDPILDDIAKVLSRIVTSLSLDMLVTADGEQREKWQGICQSLSAVLAVPHIALMSFIRSHIDISGAMPNGALSDGLQIEAPGGKICLAARRLQCLHGFLKQPIWAFNFIPKDSHLQGVDYDGFYISSSIDDLAELWGPFTLSYAETLWARTVGSIETRGGRLMAVHSSNCQVKALDDEALCHWFGWLDVAENELRNQILPIDTTKRLLIGMPGSRHSDYRSQESQRRRIRPKLEELADASGGKYLTVTVGFTYKFDAGWTLKDAILESWTDAARDDLTHIPCPHYMDYRVVLEISRCSGHARRISIWKLLQCSLLRDYFRQNLEVGVCQGIEAALQQYSSIGCFALIWPELDTHRRNILTLAFKFVLRTLKCTGVGEDGLLQVWDITSIPRIDGRRIDPQWAPLLKDDIGCATFAVITGACRKYKPPIRAYEKAPIGLPILCTQVRITANQKLTQMNTTMKECKPSQQSNEFNSRSFSSKWSVPRSNSNDIRLARFSFTVQSNSGDESLDCVGNLMNARQIISGGVKTNESTDQSVPLEPIQPKRFPARDGTNVCDDTRSKDSSQTDQSRTQRQKIPEKVTCDSSLPFKNGKGQKLGKLVLEPLEGPSESIDLTSLPDTSGLPARWQPSRSNWFDTIHQKGEQMDENFSSWVNKSSGLIPRLLRRMAPREDTSPAVVTEYIRMGDLTAYQKVLDLYIR
ncbi:hypothetical protein SBOR_7869 [Sclerotinia borealis F-4128]|uniref:Uncharacterized protein n=1 Tax=Sclerotinia borealis (strain F-4128) TaxID=1432307 RepID=W9C4S1_SCLBF|nr:hypothetical protein SBOR_7869 [Sclerotinia borealis F-4128]